MAMAVAAAAAQWIIFAFCLRNSQTHNLRYQSLGMFFFCSRSCSILHHPGFFLFIILSFSNFSSPSSSSKKTRKTATRSFFSRAPRSQSHTMQDRTQRKAKKRELGSRIGKTDSKEKFMSLVLLLVLCAQQFSTCSGFYYLP
jgi:hypothetical protein